MTRANAIALAAAIGLTVGTADVTRAQDVTLGSHATALGLKSESIDAPPAGVLDLRLRTPDIPSTWIQASEQGGVSGSPQRTWTDGPASRKSYLIPALEILGFQTALNLFDRAYFGCCDYDTDLNSIKRNLNRKWVVENDPYAINQLGHPYGGSIYHGIARSTGLSYWEAALYTFAGSAVWEIAGETTPPSKNDQIATGIGGSFLGEALYRMSNLVLEKGAGMSRPNRELLAALISPPTGFNRLVFGDRFDAVFSSRGAAYYSRFAIGATHATQDVRGTSARDVKPNEGIIDFSLDYGLPGAKDYVYRRPFDYFAFQVTGSTANGFEQVLTRGLLVGADLDAGKNFRGIWGLYGSYDYIAPQTFRISSTALSLGTTTEWRISDAMALQGTLLGGVGYAGVGTINGTRDQDYHYGIAPQALLALRLIFADRASIDLAAREYFVSDVASDRSGRGGHDNILRADAAITFRIHKQHAVSLRYLYSRRDARYPVIGDRSQTRATIGIFYTLLGHDRFGAMDWK